MAATYLFKMLTLLLLLTMWLQHQFIGEILPVAPKDKEIWTHSANMNFADIFYMFAAPIHWCKMVSYIVIYSYKLYLSQPLNHMSLFAKRSFHSICAQFLTQPSFCLIVIVIQNILESYLTSTKLISGVIHRDVTFDLPSFLLGQNLLIEKKEPHSWEDEAP